MIPEPVVQFPKTNWTASGDTVYYSDTLIQMISGVVPIVASDVERNTVFLVRQRYRVQNSSGYTAWSAFSDTGMIVGPTSASVLEIPWSFNSEDVVDLQVGDTLHLEFKTVKVSSYFTEVGTVLDESAAVPLSAIIVSETQIEASARPVSGISMKRSVDNIKIMIPSSGIILNPDNDFAGCNFYLTLVGGGGDNGYAKINDVLVTDVDTSETQETSVTQSTDTEDLTGITVTTTRSKKEVTEYYTYTVDKNVLARMIEEGKIPNVFLSDGETLSEDLIFYFVTTVTAFDKALNQAVESPFSVELEGEFVKYSTDFQVLPKRGRGDILFSMSKDMMTNNNKISVVPGYVVRDIADPVSLEFEKFYVIQDFTFALLSIDTLQNFDDADGDGRSDAVSLSTRKIALANALGVRDTTSIQILIDEQFDKWAANYNLIRGEATRARGQALFYTEIRPTVDITIQDGQVISTEADADEGVSSVSFTVVGSQIIDADNLDFYYNPTTKRYEILTNIEAQSVGTAGNVPAGTITSTTNVAPTFRVTNPLPTRFGSDQETNAQLATRIKLARSSFDSGTEPGYESAAHEVPGVLQARVEKAQDPLMMRDYDPESKKHVGGKVDIYIKGTKEEILIDQVAFKYEYPTDSLGDKVGEVFDIVDASNFRLKSTNSKVSSESPIVSVSRVRNITKAKDYSISNIQIVGDGDTIILEKNQTNIGIGMATFDVVEVTYLYRSSNSLVLSQQPVSSIRQVTSSGGTVVDPSKYTLVKKQDPLQDGYSSIAEDAVKFFFKENDDIPEFVTVTDEQHDMLQGSPARLELKGVDRSSIVVYPPGQSGSPYKKNIDYQVQLGNETEYTYLSVVSTGMIRNGDRVSVDYRASENFNVTFTTNGIVSDVQDKIDGIKHAAADAVAKEAVRSFIDLSFRVVQKTGTDKNLLKSRIRTSVANYVTKLRLGETLAQDDVINVIRTVTGVKNVQLPFLRMAKRNASFIFLDEIGRVEFETYHKTGGRGVSSYRTVDSVLTYMTSDNGGDSNLFRGVYEDNILLELVDTAAAVSRAQGRAYIQADGKIIVSTSDGAPPQTKSYKASYYTYYPATANPVGDIDTAQIEYLDVDAISMKDIEVIEEKVTKRGL
jgi:hypothetical protein